MEIYNEKIELGETLVEITIFKNYGDQLTKYGVPPIFEGFWAYITVTKKDGTPIVGFPISEDRGQLKLYKNYSDALEAARGIVNKW